MMEALSLRSENPRSIDGEWDEYLAERCREHSELQARLERGGHHDWDRRFREINEHFPGTVAQEVCAQSWGGEDMRDGAASCVDAWFQSPGHRAAVMAECDRFAYDVAVSSGGVWYATGLFVRKR